MRKFGIVMALLLFACDNDADCDPGQELIDGACFATSAGGNANDDDSADDDSTDDQNDDDQSNDDTDGAPDASTEGPGTATDAGPLDASIPREAAVQAPLDTDFGDTCTDGQNHTDCGGTAPYCAVQPGASEGNCTHADCLDDESVCPDGWSCFDLSIFSPDLPSICTED